MQIPLVGGGRGFGILGEMMGSERVDMDEWILGVGAWCGGGTRCCLR